MTPVGGGGGGSKKWLYIAAAGGAAAAAGVAISNKNHAPSAATVTASPISCTSSSPERLRRPYWAGQYGPADPPIPYSATGTRDSPRASAPGRPLHRQDRCGSRSRHQDPGRDRPFSRPHPADGRRGDHSAPHPGSWYRPVDSGDAADVPLGPAGRVPGNRPRSSQGLWTGIYSGASCRSRQPCCDGASDGGPTAVSPAGISGVHWSVSSAGLEHRTQETHERTGNTDHHW